MDHDAVSRGRDAYDRQDWADAFAELSAADGAGELEVPDLERLAVAAHLTGRDEVTTSYLERLHHVLVDAGDIARAARWTIWLAILLFLRGRHAQGGGWLSRADRMLGDADLDRPERGFLLVPAALQALESGEPARSRELFDEVLAVAERFDDPDLVTMGLLGGGQSLVAMGDVGAGVRMLDEAMVAVTTGDVSPIMAGIAYCALILTCRDVFDLRRAREWTAVLSRWCADQQGLHPYRGQCLVHRSEIMQLTGDWTGAMAEAEQACDHLSDPPGDPALGMARYQQAELLRLRGELTRAERSYREASECGHPPQPGLALLRLAQGRVEDAAAAIRREVEATAGDRVRRARVLAAYVEILLRADDLDGASDGAAQLGALATELDSDYLAAAAAESAGAVSLARGDAAGACAPLRRAWQAWRRLDAPYEAARVRVLLARAYRDLEDHDTADMELDAARHVFEHLGAAPALAEVARLARRDAAAPPGGLTSREVEVLRLVATGATNREVADALVISEKTVARHLSNMFTKLAVRSRAAATAWAYEHDLV